MARLRFVTALATLAITSALVLASLGAAADVPRSTVGESLPVPPLPFPSHDDPSLCGIPQPMGTGVTATLDGHYQGNLVEPTVYLYDSHLRNAVTGEAPSGTHVQVLYYQSNPILDYYMVRVPTAHGSFEGWVPAPFLHDVTTP
ncbi:MAG: hypothetical protein P8Y05_01625 [Deinococcales bacterium]